MNKILNAGLFLFLAVWVSRSDAQQDRLVNATYTPIQPFYDSIVKMDSLLFDAYNKCDLEKFAALVSDDIEFYHDQGGLSTSKPDIITAIRNNICGKVTRVLISGSIQVYPIAGVGAVEFGEHYFINNQESPDATHRVGRFVHIWKQADGKWLLTRVISLH